MLLLEYSDVANDAFLAVSGNVYAMIFDPLTEQAVDFSSAPPYELEAFDGDNERFSIILPATPLRTRHYHTVLSVSDFNLPDNDYGNYYTIEYWAEQILNTPDRLNDIYLRAERITILSNRRVESRLDLSQENDLIEAFYTRTSLSASATFEDMLDNIYERTYNLPDDPARVRWEAFCSVVWDTETERLTAVGWLEKDGEHVFDALSAQFRMINLLGVVIMDSVVPAIGPEGEFRIFQDGLELSPDEVYFIRAIITDSESIQHESCSAPVTWD